MSSAPASLLAPTARQPDLRAESHNQQLQLTAGSMRRWGVRSSLALADQGFTSGAGFLISLFLARWLSPAVYGAFAVAFAASLFVSGFHNVLLLEPLSVMGPARHATNLGSYFRAQIRLHFLIVGGLSLTGILATIVFGLVSPGNPLVPALAGGSLALPFFLLLWLVRRMCYVAQKPSLALSGSTIYLAVVVIGLFGLHNVGRIDPLSAFLLIGVAGLLAATVVLRRIGREIRPDKPLAVSARAVFGENWSYGRWLVGSTVLYSVSSQTQMFLVAGMLGLEAAGILRAMQLPALVMTQVISATAILVLPSFSHDFGVGAIRRMRQKAFLVSSCLFAASIAVVVVLLVLRVPTEHLLFGGKYAATAWLMPLLALVPAANSFGIGFSMALRASQRPQFDLVANAVAAPVSVLSALALIHWWGLGGAAVSMSVSFAVIALVNYLSYSKCSLWAKLGERGPQ